jgi:hypothetical protein
MTEAQMIDPVAVRDKLRPFLDTIKDAGTSNDSGAGFGEADIHVTIDGMEFVVVVKRAGGVADFPLHHLLPQGLSTP